ncbi:MAG: hypothetical protein NTV94_13470 [Planctomycetota bacterium]|nr:hypothetical protein [Planctomycetota bacterium]
MDNEDTQAAIRAIDDLRESMAFWASDCDAQVAESLRLGGLDTWVEEGQVRVMERLRDFQASAVFDASVWADLWKFTNEVIAAYSRCNGYRTDADALSKPQWEGIRERALLLLTKLPGPIDEHQLQAVIQARSSG